MSATRETIDSLEQYAAVLDQTERALLGTAGKINDVCLASEFKERISAAFSDLRSDTFNYYKPQLEERARNESPYRPEPSRWDWNDDSNPHTRTLNAIVNLIGKVG